MSNVYEAQAYEYDSQSDRKPSPPESRPTNSSGASSDYPGSTLRHTSVEASPFEQKLSRRMRRRRRVAAGAAGGLILGAIIFSGPIGIIATGLGGGVAARMVSKHGERKKDQRVAARQSNNNDEHLASATVH